jgi:hypothetical protein
VEVATRAACERDPQAARVALAHYLGGPCDDDDIVCCLVPGGGGKGWTLVHGGNAKRQGGLGNGGGGGGGGSNPTTGPALLAKALRLAAARAKPTEGQEESLLFSGAATRLVGLQVRPSIFQQI